MSVAASDFLIVGGGLAGLNAAQVLAEAGKNVALIDHSLPQANGSLGGFTRFSGAKFSLLPAGQGLMPVAGGIEKLNQQIDLALSFCGLSREGLSLSTDLTGDKLLTDDAAIRSYESILLKPDEIEELVYAISAKVRRLATVLNAKIVNLKRSGTGWVASDTSGPVAEAQIVIAAGGRAAGTLLKTAGASPQEGKGVDLGVRIEFLDRRALHPLRARGPDAKILVENTRTFCLNHPGTIYRYPYQDISIPGGIVADESEPSANFGILTRVSGKNAAIARVLSHLKTLPRLQYEFPPIVSGVPDFKDPMIEMSYGKGNTENLASFAAKLGELSLVDWDSEYRIHFPLLDWHWDVYAIGKTHCSDQPGLFVAGDAAGHARGLLQAAISGRLAALEALDYASV